MNVMAKSGTKSKTKDKAVSDLAEDIEAIEAPTRRRDASIVREVEAKAAENQQAVLGALIWWDLAGVEVGMDEAIAAVEAAGFDSKACCPKIEARGGLKKALEAIGLRASPQSGKKADDAASKEEARLFYDRLIDNADEIVMAIQERLVTEVGSGVRAEYVERQQVTYTRKTKLLTFKTTFMATEIGDSFLKYNVTYRGSEVRTIIQRVLDQAQAVVVRENGGLYFAPRPTLDSVQRLRELCGNLHPGARLTTLSILDGAGERKDVQGFAGVAIKGELEAMVEDVAKLEELKKAGETKIRPATLQARLEAFEHLREKARTYKDLLAIETGETEAALAKLSAAVEAMILS